MCIDTQFKDHLERFGLEPCSRSGEQQFHLTWHKDIRAGRRKICWDVSSGDAEAPVLLYNCHGGGGNQLWKYNYVSCSIFLLTKFVHNYRYTRLPRCCDFLFKFCSVLINLK